MEYKTGFIGCGNMATAIISGMLDNTIVSPANVFVYDVDAEKANSFPGVTVCSSVRELSKKADILFFCVKPNIVPEVAKEIKEESKAAVSIVAGLKSESLAQLLPQGTRVMRTMPNTPLLVGKGAIVVETPNNLTSGEKEFIYRIFGHLGMVKEVAGNEMDAVTGISGSGPAYVYLFIDSLAKAGVQNGLEYEMALTLARQTFEGACEMIKETKEQPEELIKKVCSPGGTTIEAMKVFREEDVAGVIAKAVAACVKRSKELSGA